jgi:hypothetical protein
MQPSSRDQRLGQGLWQAPMQEQIVVLYYLDVMCIKIEKWLQP